MVLAPQREIKRTSTDDLIDEIIEAYEETGMVPKTLDLYYDNGIQISGCAMGAYFLHKEGKPIYSTKAKEWKTLNERFGNTCAFGIGFDRGFTRDRSIKDHDDVESFDHLIQGYHVGQAVRDWWLEKDAQ